MRAARALGEVARGDAVAFEALRKAALEDEMSLVREAAVAALAKVDATAARSVLDTIAQRDVEPRVRQRARQPLESP
jgi:HEAT repeat protein